MDTLAGALTAAILGGIIIAVSFIAAILGVLIGVFAGWVVGLTPLGPMVLSVLDAAGISVSMVELGAFMGFIGDS